MKAKSVLLLLSFLSVSYMSAQKSESNEDKFRITVEGIPEQNIQIPKGLQFSKENKLKSTLTSMYVEVPAKEAIDGGLPIYEPDCHCEIKTHTPDKSIHYYLRVNE
ncbi:hypothetical protein POV27_11490 [Aureisphaera galaxeae]|uniref:hypothetical protein n=1 Tax=Aureisphaera galaxeae TaxID=1538023 RepID=UPI002350D1F8|nr:hypothetical protein [Aureisphaera galaxeae]MDC8004675.1 hypothetical protein [Aureisphaera galaxeae]